MFTHEVTSADGQPCNLAKFNVCQELGRMGRNYSRRKQFLPSIRCQALDPFVGDGPRPTKSPGPSLDGARQWNPRDHRIDGDARGEVRDERPCADAASSRDAVKPPSNRLDLSDRRSFLLALSIAKPDPDARHSRGLIQRTEGLAEPRPELGGAMLVGVCLGR